MKIAYYSTKYQKDINNPLRNLYKGLIKNWSIFISEGKIYAQIG